MGGWGRQQLKAQVGLGGKHQPIKARSLLFAAHGKCFQGKTALVARPALSLPRERGGWSFPCVKLTASTLALKTLLTILDDTDNPSRPLAVYFLGTLYSDLEPSQPPFIGARVETVPPFYRAAIETFRQLRAHVSKEDIVEAPASRLVEILYSSQFPAPVPGLGPSYIGPPLPHGSLPGEVCDFQWKKGWGVLPTKDRLFRWGLVSDVKCPNCSAVETNVHVTAQCVVAQIFWRLVAHAFPDAGVRPYVNQGRWPRGNFAFLVIALAEWVLWRNRCSSKVLQRCQRAMWPLLWRLRRELVTFLECELFLLGESFSAAANPAEDWSDWKKSFTIYERATKYHKEDDETRIALLLHVKGAELVQKYQAFTFPAAQQKFADVLQRFDEHFERYRNTMHASYVFHNLKQSKDQTFEASAQAVEKQQINALLVKLATV
ncbi:uncharacterized protein ISCGN_013075 [Ixodes scapularis]